MRLAIVRAALALVTLAPVGARAEDPPTLILEVGATLRLEGFAGLCDDLSIVTITPGSSATLTGLKVGSTLCSVRLVGGRQVYRVKVVAPPAFTPAVGDRSRDFR
ncbi:MAG: hypothetical protein IPO09_07710 [Anaeromyxobacter sp.]|nr:hypothetical protein [Anaeromyxobacter sp.]